jgi:hypothetical protein
MRAEAALLRVLVILDRPVAGCIFLLLRSLCLRASVFSSMFLSGVVGVVVHDAIVVDDHSFIFDGRGR